ncbi:nuclear pore complex protein Nup50 [Pieris rapae]|uniref:nuclear pore complex protein Nup50 n=1 Tax=Pieris rapae TaxID=64459 RepID=UPI001E27D817|nr:nuclear pore complex protein Nup50 [Pieris rapae]XP_022116080.2 nuclear pore complex protein Nup50 [Pieris rapae]
MSAKRTATTELNHDNWDQEDDEPEESEGFRIASKEVLDKRVIRTAKRRSNVTTAEGQKSVFSGFGGFNKTQKTSFDFLANLTNGKSSDGSNQEGSSLFSSKTFSNQSTALFTPSDIFNKTTNTDVNNKEGSSTLFTSKTFTPQSKGLFTPSDVSKPAPSKFENPSLQTTSSSTKSTAVENQTNVKNSESPFKNTTSTPINTNNFTYKPHSGNSDNPVSQTTNNIFSGQAENIISNKSVKLPSSSNTCSASPSHKCHFIIDTNKSQKNDTDDDYIIIKCDPTDEKTLNYYKNLAGLNISFSKWIKKNVDELPLCILSPTFKDYENHLKNIRAEYFNRDGAQGDFAQNVKSPKMPSVAQANNVVSHTAVISNKSTSSTTEEKKSSNMVFGTPASNNTQAKDMGSLFGKMAKEQSFTTSNTAAQANNILSQTGATSHKSMSSTPEEKKSSNIVFGTPSPNCSQPKDMGSLFGNVPKVQSFTTFSSSAAHTNSILSHTHATTPVSTISKPDEKKSSSMIFGTPTTNNTQEKNIGSLFGNMQKMQSFTTSSSTAGQSNNILSHTHATTPVSTISKPDEKKSSSMIFGTPTTNNTQEKNIGSLFGNMQKMQSFTTSSSTAAQSNNILSQTSVTSNESTHPIPEEKKSTNMIFGTPTSNNTQAKDMGSLFSNMPQVQSTTTSSSTTQSPTLGFSFGSSSVANSTPTTSSGGFTFGINNSPQTSLFATKPIVSNINGNSQFSFGAGKPFSFNSNIQRKDESNEETKEDEDEPPKVEYTPMVEENSVFERKCKIFVKKDGNFVDKGVGTLYIKKIEDSRKHQLLVRANTSLGTILLNLVLATSVPTQRMGKNNVMLVCIPTPDAKPPPTPVLIRVKTSEEADELLEKLNNYKQ